MVACNFDGLITLITKKDFGDLAKRLMPELDTMEISDFILGVTTGITASQASIKKHKAWGKTFLNRLNNEFKAKGFFPVYTFANNEAQLYLEDFLEAFRFSYKSINYEYLKLENTGQELVNIELLRRQSNIVELAFKREIKPYKTITFNKDEVKQVRGTSRVFWLSIKEKVLEFTEDEVRFKNV